MYTILEKNINGQSVFAITRNPIAFMEDGWSHSPNFSPSPTHQDAFAELKDFYDTQYHEGDEDVWESLVGIEPTDVGSVEVSAEDAEALTADQEEGED